MNTISAGMQEYEQEGIAEDSPGVSPPYSDEGVSEEDDEVGN